ncbi:gastrokine-1 [Eublepharis macularius]|uniref:Gastrokine-1 n=1 Tax=Eublepharis macularius TaxID=481883 RepID=A0AA97LEV4_EUBMA|nr:gastrokine-1 [Eublepharis macularius]
MKLLILSVALLGVFLSPVLTTDNVNVNNQGNRGGNSHQSVSIDNQKQVVNVDNNNGWHSWNTVWDYRSGYIATRIFAKKSCIIAPLNKHIMPDVTVLPQAIKEKQKTGAQGPPSKQVTYTVSRNKITDLSSYGKNIENLCRGLPTYLAHEVKAPSFLYYSGSCFNANILCLLGISYCGETFEA